MRQQLSAAVLWFDFTLNASAGKISHDNVSAGLAPKRMIEFEVFT
jgi:hypothetical protein